MGDGEGPEDPFGGPTGAVIVHHNKEPLSPQEIAVNAYQGVMHYLTVTSQSHDWERIKIMTKELHTYFSTGEFPETEVKND